jgi:uncharacterized protein YndB with AHSA1/START domain
MIRPGRTVVSRVIDAPCAAVYRAYIDPDAVAAWLPPGSMTGVVHAFDAREGGAFSMSLVYPDDDAGRGKTTGNTDTFRGRFATLTPNQRIVWVVEFDSANLALAGEMIVDTTLAPAGDATEVTVTCENIPPGVRPEDNEAGCRSTLEKLAAFLARRRDA